MKHLLRSTSLKQTHQLHPHIIDDDFLILVLTNNVLRLAQLQDVFFTFLEDMKFHYRPNLRHISFKSDRTNSSSTLKNLFVASSINSPLTRKQESSIRQTHIILRIDTSHLIDIYIYISHETMSILSKIINIRKL